MGEGCDGILRESVFYTNQGGTTGFMPALVLYKGGLFGVFFRFLLYIFRNAQAEATLKNCTMG